MAEIKITTELDNRVFVPGETIRGTVAWEAAAGDSLHPEVRLFYFTHGKGTMDVEVVKTVPFPQAASRDTRAFEFAAPESPYSFSGRLVSLVWAVEAELWSGGPVDRVELTVSPSGKEVELYAHAEEELIQAQKKKLWFKVGGR